MTGRPRAPRRPEPGATKRCPVRSRMKTLPPRNARRSAARAVEERDGDAADEGAVDVPGRSVGGDDDRDDRLAVGGSLDCAADLRHPAGRRGGEQAGELPVRPAPHGDLRADGRPRDPVGAEPGDPLPERQLLGIDPLEPPLDAVGVARDDGVAGGDRRGARTSAPAGTGSSRRRRRRRSSRAGRPRRPSRSRTPGRPGRSRGRQGAPRRRRPGRRVRGCGAARPPGCAWAPRAPSHRRPAMRRAYPGVT